MNEYSYIQYTIIPVTGIYCQILSWQSIWIDINAKILLPPPGLDPMPLLQIFPRYDVNHCTSLSCSVAFQIIFLLPIAWIRNLVHVAWCKYMVLACATFIQFLYKAKQFSHSFRTMHYGPESLRIETKLIFPKKSNIRFVLIG